MASATTLQHCQMNHFCIQILPQVGTKPNCAELWLVHVCVTASSQKEDLREYLQLKSPQITEPENMLN